MNAHYYPVALNLRNKSALVIGAGEVAERKARALLEAGAKVQIVSPEATSALRGLAKQHKIRWIKRLVKRSDVLGPDIIIAATSSQQINKKVSLWAKKRKTLLNLVDQPRLSGFISPAVLHTPQATVAVYTNGRNPGLSRDLKNFLKEHWDVFLSYRNRL